MFLRFFYLLRENGIPVAPTSFLKLNQAMDKGLVTSLGDFYTAARTVLIKSERFFDLYDQIFAHHFHGIEMKPPDEVEISEVAKMLLDQWLKNPKELAEALGIDESKLKKLNPDQLIDYFKDRLKEQKGEHHGGNKWIGTGGTSPVGHSGFHPGGMRVGGASRNQSAVKVAMERRYRDYSQSGPLSFAQMGEALKRLRHLKPTGPKNEIDIPATLEQTMKNAGEIEILYKRSLKDRLTVILAIDNGGWSMDPYVERVQVLFKYAQEVFKDVKTFYFHNTVYDKIWEDPRRVKKQLTMAKLLASDPETRIIFVGDASMAPYELISYNGVIDISQWSGTRSYENLQKIAQTFPHSVWLNPRDKRTWRFTETIGLISRVFPMHELTLDGLDQAIQKLMP